MGSSQSVVDNAIVVSTSVCGTESSGLNPDQDLLFNLDHFSRLERPFYFFLVFSYLGT